MEASGMASSDDETGGMSHWERAVGQFGTAKSTDEICAALAEMAEAFNADPTLASKVEHGTIMELSINKKKEEGVTWAAQEGKAFGQLVAARNRAATAQPDGAGPGAASSRSIVRVDTDSGSEIEATLPMHELRAYRPSATMLLATKWLFPRAGRTQCVVWVAAMIFWVVLVDYIYLAAGDNFLAVILGLCFAAIIGGGNFLFKALRLRLMAGVEFMHNRRQCMTVVFTRLQRIDIAHLCVATNVFLNAAFRPDVVEEEQDLLQSHSGSGGPAETVEMSAVSIGVAVFNLITILVLVHAYQPAIMRRRPIGPGRRHRRQEMAIASGRV